MCNKALRWALSARTRNATQKCVLLVLADRADTKGVAFPGQKLLAESCCCSEDAVQAAIKQLKKDGLLAVEPRYAKSGRRTSNIYRLPLEDIGFTRPHSAAKSKSLTRDLPPGVGGHFTPLHNLNPNIEPSEREAALSLTKDVLIDQKEQATTATVVNLIAKPMPEDWQPNEGETAFARECGLCAEEITAEAASFVSHYLSTDRNALQRNWSERWKQWIRHYDPSKSKVGKRSAWNAALKASSTHEPAAPPDSTSSGNPVLPFQIKPNHLYWARWMAFFRDNGHDDWASDAEVRGTIHAETLLPHSKVRFSLPKPSALASGTTVRQHRNGDAS